MQYLSYDVTYWSCDIEADDLRDEASVIWCVCVCNVQTREEQTFTDADSFRDFLEASDRVLIGHNFLAYDAPVLNRIWKTRIAVSQIIDTFVLSQMYNPKMHGHGLGHWGERLGYPKGDHSDFSRLTPEMLKYCRRDARLTALLYRKLVERMNREKFSETGVEIEHLAWNIIQNKQKQNGFPFDQQKADILYAELRAREQELKDEIYRLWPPILQIVRRYAKSCKSDGTRTANYLRHLSEYPKLEDNDDGSYHAYDYVPFDLGSPQQRIQKLLDLGWKPVNFTEKGSPKIDEDELLAFAKISGVPEAAALAKWVVVNARANMINTWIEAVNPKTGSIHGSLFLASTMRYKHSKPNTANIPGTREDSDDNILIGEAGTWAYECRSLWTSGGKGWKLVGIDGKGIQLRCLAHNVAKVIGVEGAQEFIDTLLTGDPHRKNMALHGFPSKPAAKKAIYTILMGGGSAKIAQDQVQFGWQPKKSLKDDVIDSIPGFRKLIERLQTELRKTGRITLCDGTRLLVPSDHMVIPYLLQGDESRLMKKAMILTDQAVRRAGLSQSVLKVGDIHDEFQTRVREGLEDTYVDLTLPTFLQAGEFFNYLIPIEGDYKIGDHWGETH